MKDKQQKQVEKIDKRAMALRENLKRRKNVAKAKKMEIDREEK